MSRSISSSRPTSGVVAARKASNRLSAVLTLSTCHAGTLSAKPLTATAPRSRYSNRPPVSACGDHHGAWLRQRLKASGKVWPLSNHGLFLSRPRAYEVADHYKAGGDADTNLQGRTGVRGELRNRFDKTEPVANRALSIMFMRFGVTEIDQNGVTHVFGDEATIAFDQFGAQR